MARVHRIVSGAQTGVDRAALDFAMSRAIDHGGWVPRGRKAEDGRVSAIYHVQETETSEYRERTRKNVLDSDGTLIVHRGRLSGGTALTRAFARKEGRPVLLIDIDARPMDEAAPVVRDWIVQNSIATLNVAGPRESQSPGIYDKTRRLLEQVFDRP